MALALRPAEVHPAILKHGVRRLDAGGATDEAGTDPNITLQKYVS